MPHHSERVPSAAVSRRGFLQSAAVGTVIMTTPRIASAASASAVKIESPFDGAILNRRHGKPLDGKLSIPVVCAAPLSEKVTINGQAARREGDKFVGDVALSGKVTEIVAASGEGAGRGEDRVRVVWDRYSRPRYHFAVDDNIYFLRDIARKRYASLFDCFYLKTLRDLHQKYGTRFSVNIYFAADDGFTLPEFPDRYKSEWKDNAGWLRLAFHAHADAPARPYQDAPAEKLIRDYDQVAEQIHRFAGAETFAPPTNLHWSMATPDALKALHQRGVRVLSGYFQPIDGRWDINYNFDARRSEYVSKNDLWMDFASGIIFIRDAIVCNATPVDRVAPTLDPLAREPDRRDTVNLLTHEQYFWPFYAGYVADHAERCEAAIRWATDHGYEPVFFHEGLLGGKE
ncbi:MAG: hypothetical protein NTW96_02940 [Planctomycetia bacterium]|nr:hypothetical protein [Planctomycetia bacterium]